MVRVEGTDNLGGFEVTDAAPTATSRRVRPRLLPLRPLVKRIDPSLAFKHIDQLCKPLPIFGSSNGKAPLSLALRP